MDMEQLRKLASETAQTVAEKSTDLAHAVVRKSGDIVEISKIKYGIFDLKKDVKKLYTQIGQEVYEQLEPGGFPEEIRMKFEILDAKLAKIEALQEKAKNLSDAFACPECGRECGDEDEVCPYCGAELTVSMEAEYDNSEE